jgi:hypothetical protein
MGILTIEKLNALIDMSRTVVIVGVAAFVAVLSLDVAMVLFLTWDSGTWAVFWLSLGCLLVIGWLAQGYWRRLLMLLEIRRSHF